MKCRKCGYELRETDKFCPECGAKTVSSEPDLKKSKLNSNFRSSISKKSLIGALLSLAFIILVVVIGFIIKNTSNAFESEAEPNEMVDYSTYQLNELMFLVPSDWEFNRTISGLEFASDDNSSLIVDCKIFPQNVGVIQVNEYIDDFEYANDYIFSDKGFAFINDELVFKRSYTIPGSVSSVSTYTFSYNNTVYCFIFKYLHSIDDIENYIIDNSYILNYSSSVETTYTEPTTIEPTTDAPTTEKPTDISDTMTLLFEDSEISVYYSDVESGYFDDEVDVHLFVENKMDKSIKIQSDTVILDGVSYNDVTCSDPISANTRGMIEITVDDCNNVSPSSVGADLRYFYSDHSGDTVNLYIASQSVK